MLISILQGAWDSYVQGTGPNAMDPSSIWPINFDLSQMGDVGPGMGAQGQQGGAGAGSGGAGASGGTPGMM